MAYEKIFEPLRLNNGFAKNRIWTAPTMCVFPSHEGYATERTAKFYGARAAGGAGTVTIGETAVDWEYGKSHAGMLNIWGTEAASALADVVERIHYGGARASIELCHGGVWAYPNLIGGKNPIGPSRYVREDGVVVEEMTEEQMNDIADHFAEASLIMKKCGFDSVMIHAAHGWLLGAFISRLDNKRTDKYGGSLENRARFPLMVLDRVREAVGNDLTIEFRFSVTEDTKDGITVEEAVEFLKMAESRIDVIHQSYGTRRDSSTRDRANGSQFYDYGYNLKYAKALKDAGIKIPVVSVGAWDNADKIEEALENGWLDGVSIGKGIIADPQFVNKVKEERIDDIVPCLKCFKCFAGGGRDNADKVPRFSKFSTNRYRCSVNPNYGRENFPTLEPAVKQKHVVVVGGGPAGLRAALTAANRGHKVTVLEKSERLGGIINYADFVDFKRYVKKYRDYLVNQTLKNENIEVVLNTEGTKEIVKSYNPDSVIIAFGGQRREIHIPGKEKNDVWNVADIYGKENSLGENIVIVGGNESGVEAAIHLLDLGKKVTIVASRSRLVPYTDFTARLPLIYRVENRAQIVVNSRVTEIEERSVKIHNKEDGTDQQVTADSVVFAIGADDRIDDALTYSDIARDFYVIGDAFKVSDIENATKTAYDAAIRI